MRNHLRLAGVLALSLALAAPARAQTAGEPYQQLRGELLAQGWKPDESFGLRMINSGKPLHHYPEVLCGPQICKAKWRDRAGKDHAIRLDRGVNQDHRVAAEQSF